MANSKHENTGHTLTDTTDAPQAQLPKAPDLFGNNNGAIWLQLDAAWPCAV